MDLRRIYVGSGAYSELRQHAPPYSFELAGRRFDVEGKELFFSARPNKTVVFGGKELPAYVAKATDTLIFALIDKRAYVFETETGAFVYADKKGQGAGGQSAAFKPELASGLGGNKTEWQLGMNPDAKILLEYTPNGATVGIQTPMRMSLKLDDFFCVSLAPGVYFQYGHAGFGPASGSFALVTDYTKVTCVGAAIIMSDVIPAGGWGRIVD